MVSKSQLDCGLNMQRIGSVCLAILFSVNLPTHFAFASPSTAFFVVEASANSEDDFDALTARAAEKYAEKNFSAAIELFEQAYKIKPEVNILFNLGRIYEEAGNYEKAIGYYEQFVADTAADYEARQRALRRLTLLRETVKITKRTGGEEKVPDKRPSEASNPEDEKLLKSEQQTPEKVTPEVKKPVPEQPPPEQKSKKITPLHIAGFSTLGISVALLISGGATAGRAVSYHNQFEQAMTLDEKRFAANHGKRLALTGDALLITGGVFAAASIVLLTIPEVKKYRQSHAKAQIVPAVSPTTAGLSIYGHF